MQAALQNLQRHRNSTLAELQLNLDQLWAIERGLQLIAQNALDIATHLVAAAGFDSADYTTAIDRLVTIRALSPEFAARLPLVEKISSLASLQATAIADDRPRPR